jgi:diguanylate cyclase
VGSAIALLIAVCIAAALAGVLYERQRTLAEQAITDPLTGAFNRRHLDPCLTQAIERHRRTGEPASLLLFDIDHFKRVNDRRGHAAGDEALTRLTALVAARARKMDVLFRIGGDEFVLLLPGAARAGALAVAETLRALVADAALVDGRRLSISVGVSELLPEQSAFAWLDDADAALYRAKHAGRNRASLSGRRPFASIGRRAVHA